MRVLGTIQTETSDSLTDSLLAFSVSYRRAWYGLGNGFRLITQRSVVQIHPPQPNISLHFNGLGGRNSRAVLVLGQIKVNLGKEFPELLCHFPVVVPNHVRVAHGCAWVGVP